MKRVSILAALLLLFSALIVRAEIVRSGFCGEDPNPGDGTVEYGENLSWTLTDDGVLTISGSGRMFDASYDASIYNYNTPWYAQGNLIKTAVIGQGVTSIGAYAFYVCPSLSDIVIPASVTQMGSNVFAGCRALASVSIPESVTAIPDSAFYGCTSLDGVILPGSTTSIGAYAFWGCSALSEIVIPEGVIQMENGAFYGCRALASVSIPEGITFIPSFAFYDCSSLDGVIIPQGVTNIGSSAFNGCRSLSEIVIPESVTWIGIRAFAYCYALSSIYVPESVTTICSEAFYRCSSLHSITVPESVTSIGNGAFYGCSALVSVFIPEGVTIESSPFNEYYSYVCTTYGQYPLLESLIIRSDIDFDGQILDFAASPLLRRLEVPASVFNDGRDDVGFTKLPIDSAIVSLGTIDYKGFEFLTQCRNTLRHIDLSAAENTELPAEALSNCFMAETILLPSGLESIGYSAFSGCKSLKSIDIPASVTDIDDSAFEDCRSITAINFGGTEGAQAQTGRAAASRPRDLLGHHPGQGRPLQVRGGRGRDRDRRCGVLRLHLP